MRAILVFLLLVPLLASAEIYKWTDEKGVVHFTSDPNRAAGNAEAVEVGPTNSGSIVNQRQKNMADRLEAEREMKEAFQQIRRGAKQERESSSCKLYRVWLEDEKSELKALRRHGYTVEEEQYQERQVEEAQRRVKAFC